MHFRDLVFWILTFGVLSYAQERKDIKKYHFFHPDSAITTTLEDVVVKAQKPALPEPVAASNITLYNNDANKIAMSQVSGVFNIVPLYSKIRINNLDDQYIGLSYEDMPLLMDITQLHGGFSAINSQISDITIYKTAYPSRFSTVGGIMAFDIKNDTTKRFEFTSNIIDRSLSHFDNYRIGDSRIRVITAYHNVSVYNKWKTEKNNLKIIPEINTLANKVLFEKGDYQGEVFVRASYTHGGFDDDDVSIHENTHNTFVFLRNSLNTEFGKINLKTLYEENNVNGGIRMSVLTDTVRNYNRDIAAAADIENRNIAAGARIFFLRNASLKESRDKTVMDAYADYKMLLGSFILQPGLRIIDGDALRISSSTNITYFLDNNEAGVGYGHPVNMLVVNNSSGERNTSIKELRDQIADHYYAYVRIDPAGSLKGLRGIIDDIDISAYKKNFIASGEHGSVKGLDMMIRNYGLINYSIKYSVGDAELNGGKMPGAIDRIIDASLAFPVRFALPFPFIPDIIISAQYVYNDGYFTRISNTEGLERVGKSNYLGVGIIYNFTLFNSVKMGISGSMFNMLSLFNREDVPEFARYKTGDEIKSAHMPALGDIRITANIEY